MFMKQQFNDVKEIPIPLPTAAQKPPKNIRSADCKKMLVLQVHGEATNLVSICSSFSDSLPGSEFSLFPHMNLSHKKLRHWNEELNFSAVAHLVPGWTTAAH